MSGRCQGTLGEVWDESRDSRGGPGRVGGPSGRSRTGRATFGRSERCQGTLGEVWDGSEILRGVQDGSEDPRGSETGLGTLVEVRDG